MSTEYVRSLVSHLHCYNFGPRKGIQIFIKRFLKHNFLKILTFLSHIPVDWFDYCYCFVAAGIGPDLLLEILRFPSLVPINDATCSIELLGSQT